MNLNMNLQIEHKRLIQMHICPEFKEQRKHNRGGPPPGYEEYPTFADDNDDDDAFNDHNDDEKEAQRKKDQVYNDMKFGEECSLLLCNMLRDVIMDIQ